MIYEAHLQKIEDQLAERAALRERADELLKWLVEHDMAGLECAQTVQLEHVRAALRVADEALIAMVPVLTDALRRYAKAMIDHTAAEELWDEVLDESKGRHEKRLERRSGR